MRLEAATTLRAMKKTLFVSEDDTLDPSVDVVKARFLRTLS